MEINSYPSIYAIGHKALNSRILDGPVVVQEKMDGSQFSFGRKGLQLFVRSKGQVINPFDPPVMFKLAVETVLDLYTQGRLPEGVSFRGEAITSPKHNVLKYDRIPEGGVILFDADEAWDLQRYLEPHYVQDWGRLLDLEVVPTYHYGEILTNDWSHFLGRESCLGGVMAEGIVIKNYNQFGVDKKILIAKIVRESFKEAHAIKWGQPKQGGILDEIVKSLKTEARWEKAISHLRERDELVNGPQDIGPLMKEIQTDTLKECIEDIKDALFKWAWKERLSKSLTQGFPEWYKARLSASVSADESANSTVTETAEVS